MAKEMNKEALKILLLYPRYPDTFWSFKHVLRFASKKAFIPPLGILTVAALLPQGWKRKFIDLNVSELQEKDIQWADYVFLSATEIQRTSVREIITKVRTHGKKIVAGGPLFTVTPDRFREIDHLVLNEAEATLPFFIEDLNKGEEKPIYSSTEWPEITCSPVPEWSLLDIHKYAVMSVQYSRGCPFNCEFCDIGFLNGKKPRTKTADQILRELELLYQKGWRGIVFFVDDNFIGKPHQLKQELLPALAQWMEEKRYPFSFLTQASINLIDDEELMKSMVRAGFDSVFVGIESPEERSLYECHKIQNKHRDLLSAVRKMQRSGLQVLGGFIVGFDNDSPATFQKQIDFIQQSGIVTAMVGLLGVSKGAKLYKRLQQEGRVTRETTGDNTDFSTNFIPKMGYQILIDGYRYLVNYIYSPPHFYERIMTFLNNYVLSRKTDFNIQFCDIKAFLQSILALGIIGEERFYYWRTLFWTAFRHPHFLPLYVRLAIYGYHFRKVFQPEIHKTKSLNGFINPEEETRI